MTAQLTKPFGTTLASTRRSTTRRYIHFGTSSTVPCQHQIQHTDTTSSTLITMTTSNSNSEVFILHPILVDRRRITKQISMFPGVRTQTQTKTFSAFYEEYVDCSSFRSIGSLFVFHARDAATEKALSLIRRHVCSMMRLSHNEARSADRAGISATGVSKSEMYSVQEATCELASTVCTGSSLRLVTSATLGEQPESHGHRA